MPFVRETALRAAGLIMAIGIAWVAAGFLALGLYEWLIDRWGAPGAAFATAGVCLLVAAGVVTVTARHAPGPVFERAQQQPAAVGQSASLVSALRDLTQDHPLLAVCAAAILGAVGAGDETKRR